jgi:hypothetical protein
VSGEVEGGLVVADEAVVVLIEPDFARHLLLDELAVLKYQIEIDGHVPTFKA